MFEKELGNVPQIARTLVNHLPEEMDAKLKELIAKAEVGQDTTIEIINLFAQHETTRGWMKKQITSLPRRDGPPIGSPPGYGGLAGIPSVPMSQRWICLEKPSEHWIMVIQEGEKPPICKLDNTKMVRGASRKDEL